MSSIGGGCDITFYKCKEALLWRHILKQEGKHRYFIILTLIQCPQLGFIAKGVWII